MLLPHLYKRKCLPVAYLCIGWLPVGWFVRWSICHAAVKELMQQIWDVLTANYHCSLYASMARQMQMVMEAEGVVTRSYDMNHRQAFFMHFKPMNCF